MSRQGLGSDEVYRSRPDEFVRTRNAVAAELRKAGQDDQAAKIQSLRKPSPALWVVNKLAHELPDGVADLVKAVEHLQSAQIRAQPHVSEAAGQQRRALDRLVTRAAILLKGAGLPASPAVLNRVSGTLLGAAVDPDARSDLRRGRLTEERSAPGFEAFALRRVRPGVADSFVPETARERRPATERQHAEADRRARSETAQARRTAQRQARAANRRATQLEQKAIQRERVAGRAAKIVESLREELGQAEERLSGERHAADEAARFAARARQEAERAASAVSEDE